MTAPENISIQDFSYDLPEGKIALFPLEQRDQSKMLIYRNGSISESVFSNITEYLPQNTLLVFNNSKVINARIKFEKKTGSKIEIFCLEPSEAINEYSTVMNQRGTARWKCFIGGAAKWKEDYQEKIITINEKTISLKAAIVSKVTDAYIVEFTWTPSEFSFAEIIETAGDIPLPPYIKRVSEVSDANRYQTIYAANDGSVAAPTAGLHFSASIFQQLADKKISTANVTLHVGAGTFKPVKANQMKDHEMHAEWIDVDIATIKQLINHKGMIGAVGTTSLRTIETLYWLGVKTHNNPEIEKLELGQWDVYDDEIRNYNLSIEESLTSLMNWLARYKKEKVFTQTQLLITPGYQFKIAQLIVTNFHQPQSTLLLIIAAAIGNDWKKCYQYALENNFRFLSYGDANLLFMAES
jgi:S-adenosylmethionine:tRNA ribosyltransferase-isomerase